MNSAQSVLRSLIVYAVCLPLAVFLGYVLANPEDIANLMTLGVVVSLLAAPLFFRFHYPLMLLTWNMSGVLFFLPGRPQLWMGAVALSFMISFTQRILNKDVHPIRVPEISRPLIVLSLIILATAKITGGIGLRSMGADVYGGKRYITLLLTILGYFALVAHPIPRNRARLYVALFLLSGLSCLIGDLYPVIHGPATVLFWVFPVYSTTGDFDIGVTRMIGASAGGAVVFTYLIARHGVAGALDFQRPWRFVAMVVFALLGMLGGFRSMVISIVGIFILQFFLEGLHRTRLLPLMILMSAILATAVVPFSTKLPFAIQRAIAFLPIELDPLVRQSATVSSEWRLQMWKAVLPQVPQYLLIGKGLAMVQRDYNFAAQFGEDTVSADQWGAALAGDYHNGPLSVIIPFGIWGMIAFLWFLYGGFKVLWNNYKYGDPELRNINTFLLASYIIRVLMFFFIVGGFVADMSFFVATLGLSIAMNNGVARKVAVPAADEAVQVRNLATILPRQRPVLGR